MGKWMDDDSKWGEYEFALGCPSKEAVKVPSIGSSARPASSISVTIGVGWNTRQHCSLLLPPTSHLFSTRTMSQTHAHPTASSSSNNFQSVLDAALEAYEKKTKTKLLDHPLAAQLQSCDSPTAVLSVLQELIQQFDRRRSSDERLSSWLGPTVSVLYAFSSTLGQGVGIVSLI